MENLVQRVARNVRDRKLLTEGERVLVAVSGGVDSMVLLAILSQLAVKFRWRLTVAHFNHRLRGRASDADECLVRAQAQRLGLPFVSGAGDVRAEARRHGFSIEMAARGLRHRFFARTARRRRIPSIALAHHADDQVELFFLRLLRGAAAEGLGGMRWSGPSPFGENLRLARPLLNVSKRELAAFAERERLVFREDASNAGVDHLRNRIRHDLLPRLEKNYQPGLRAVIARLAESLADDAEVIGARAAKWRAGPRSAFRQLARAVQRRVLVEELIQAGLAPEFELVERLRQSPRSVSVPGARIVSRDERGRIRVTAAERAGFRPGRRKVNLTRRSGNVSFGGGKITWSLARGGDSALRRARSPRKFAPPGRAAAGAEFFDADKVGRQIVLRHWSPGDRFQPIGMKQPVKLQDLFVNLKVPANERRQRVVAKAASGGIFWVEGLRMSERFKLDTATRRLLKWGWYRP